MTIGTAPPAYSFLENTIPVVVTETAVNFKKFTYKVTVNAQDSETFEAYRDSANEAIFDISDLLKAFFDIADYPTIPVYSVDIQIANNETEVIKSYLLTITAEYTTGPPQVIANTYKVVQGGVSYLKKDTDTMLVPTFTNALPALSSFSNKSTTKTAKEYITFANIFFAGTVDDFYLRYTLFDANDNTIVTDTIDIAFCDKDKTTVLDVSYSKIVAPNTLLECTHYAVQLIGTLTGSGTEYKSQILTFYIDSSYYPQQSEFLFVNQRGGLSTARLFGEREDMTDMMREQVERYLSPLASLPTSPAYSRINSEIEGFKINTSYFDSWEDFQIILALSKATAIWEIVGSTLIPVRIDTKKISTKKTDKLELASASLEFTYLVSRNEL